jgi:signal transduction histidine kinase
VGAETDLELILELVAKRGRALVSARALVIELRDKGELLVAAGAGELPEGVIGERLELADTVAANAMRTKATQRLEDQLSKARFREHGLGKLGVQAGAGLVVPLIFRDRSYGVLVAIDRLQEGPSFGFDDERLLEAFASSAAVAVATAQSVATERQRQRLEAAEAERRHWARELHDETLQSLSALRIGLSGAARSEEEGALGRAVAQGVDQLEEAIADLRALITDLRPAALDELGVHAALEGLVARSERHGIEIDINVELAFELGRAETRHVPEIETAIYRIVQEALTNAVKHGNARRAVVEVREDAATVVLSVRDNGAGFDPSHERNGFGLIGMGERVELLGGDLAIESEPGRGATVRVSLPVRRRPRGEELPHGGRHATGT